MSGIALDFSGIQLRLRGLSAELVQRFEQDWRNFVVARAESPFLELELSFVDEPLPEDKQQQILAIPDVFSVKMVEL